MSAEFLIRQARSTDEPAIQACAEMAYAQYVATIGKRPAPMDADFAHLIASGFVYVAVESHADLQGFIVFFREGDHVFLENVAVQPDATGTGIGRRLIAFCEQEAKRAGASSVKLYTNEKMTENLRFYPYLGYQEVERKTQSGFNRVFFEKTL